MKDEVSGSIPDIGSSVRTTRCSCGMSESLRPERNLKVNRFDLEKITTRSQAREALMGFTNELLLCRGAEKEALQSTQGEIHIPLEDWIEQIKGLRHERIPVLEEYIRMIEEKMPSLPES